jgi:putative N6-adenine-specific DNA methylase
MQETLAAGVIMTACYAGKGNFINPMCGSGTLAVEAALVAMNKAPGLIRRNFGFMHTLLYDAAVWERLRGEAQQAVRPFTGKIIATDIAPEAVSAAMSNAKAAGLAGVINFRTCDFADTTIPEGQGVVVLNPEYGIRMGADKELTTLYRRIGDFFKKKCQGYTGYLFTAAPELAGKIGLKSRRRYTFYSGSIECRLYEYDLYGKK